jgi:hypothetical protein
VNGDRFEEEGIPVWFVCALAFAFAALIALCVLAVMADDSGGSPMTVEECLAVGGVAHLDGYGHVTSCVIRGGS